MYLHYVILLKYNIFSSKRVYWLNANFLGCQWMLFVKPTHSPVLASNNHILSSLVIKEEIKINKILVICQGSDTISALKWTALSVNVVTEAYIS